MDRGAGGTTWTLDTLKAATWVAKAIGGQQVCSGTQAHLCRPRPDSNAYVKFVLYFDPSHTGHQVLG